jgi:hypothetical protein
MLRYRRDADEWDELPRPEPTGYFDLAAVTDGMLAFNSSHENGPVPDYLWLLDEERWEALPDDPLPLLYDRTMLEHAGRIYLFGSPSGVGAEDSKLGASYDPATGVWEELTPSGTMGYPVWSAGELLYLNPHFSNAAGGIYDPVTDAWSPWPELPHHDLVGVIADDAASYEYAEGWVFDARNESFLQIEPRPSDIEVYDETIARAGLQNLFVFGGQTWVSDEASEDEFTGEAELLNDTWLWTPPGARLQ